MRYIKILMIAGMAIALMGCEAKPTSEPSGQGYVFEISEGRVLILDHVKEDDFGKSWIDIFEDYTGNAIWLTTSTWKYKVGQKVRYWVEGGVDESFPSQGNARKIEIIKDKA
ncbi:YobA family protein [Paenibacillus sp. PL91]|uniref:YobA family protein n=1 Tax=Paenibacillus sp. PL91 TaxID=2729538 RepID=UPI00145DC677|nr:YobA family protein [Paenibacillus sp. PL91]MBC9200349.1 YobA family protein [Paenibacillus sp. PL91]